MTRKRSYKTTNLWSRRSPDVENERDDEGPAEIRLIMTEFAFEPLESAQTR